MQTDSKPLFLILRTVRFLIGGKRTIVLSALYALLAVLIQEKYGLQTFL